MKQALSDIQLLIKTDKRIAAACGFVLLVLIIFMFTDTWREPKKPHSERVLNLKTTEVVVPESSFTGLTESLSSVSKTNNNLKDDLTRVSRELETKQEEIDWKVDSLVTRLSNMTSTIGKITEKVGEKKVSDVAREQRQRSKVAQKNGTRIPD